MATEQKVFPIDPSTLSWRDKLRNLATTKYGNTGRQFSEAILGESEEEKYMNYLEKIEAGLLPPPKNFSPNRPVSDMLGGEGISDFGLLDAGLMGLSGAAIPKISTGAALTESGVLGADAVGEYKKGNTTTAAIMGTLAGVPPLLRYANPVKNTSSKEVAEEVQPDLTRRKVVQGLGISALAAPFVDPVVMAARQISKAPNIPGLAKLTPPIKSILDHTNVFLYNNELVDNLVSKYGKAEDEFISSTEIESILTRLASKDLNNLTLKQIKEIAGTSKNVEVTDDFLKDAVNTIENLKDAVRNDPATKKELDKLNKLYDMSEDEIEAFYNRGADTVHYDRMDDLREAFEKYKP
jgi:hypothetical protein